MSDRRAWKESNNRTCENCRCWVDNQVAGDGSPRDCKTDPSFACTGWERMTEAQLRYKHHMKTSPCK